MVAARVFLCLLARASGAGGDTGGISGIVSPCTLLHGVQTETYDNTDCTGKMSTSALMWDSCVSEMEKNGDDAVTWKSYKSYAEMLINGTFVFKVQEPYTGAGCEDNMKGKAATPIAMDKCESGLESGHKFQYTSHCGKFLKYAQFPDDACDANDNHKEGNVIPIGTCHWVSDDGNQCPVLNEDCNVVDKVPMQRFVTVECDGKKDCTVRSFSDSMCKNEHVYWADYNFKADGTCQAVTVDKVRENSASWTPAQRVLYRKLAIDGAYIGEDGSGGIRMSQAVGFLMFAVAYTSR
jgi:hypothetical protein